MRDYPIGFIVETVQGKSLQFNCVTCTDVYDLISSFLEGLKARSRFVVAIRKVEKAQVEAGFLTFDKGDLLILDDVAGQNLMTASWGAARNERTGFAGSVQSQNVWILSTLQKPDAEMVKLFKMNELELEKLSRKTMAASNMEMNGPSGDNYYTLEEYASEFFRQDKKNDSSGVINVKSGKTAPDWCKTIEPINAPLLQRTPGRLHTDAMLMFLSILKYTGDFPARKSDYVTELTDQIFRAAIDKIELRDELYCQLMKQLTRNMKISEERTWELFWLCCGLFAPSPQLYPHVTKFLSTRSALPMATECAARLYKANRNGARTCPPHSVEVEAIKHQTTQILHKIKIGPDGDFVEIFSVDASTRAGDLCNTIAKRLEMKNHDGFALFVRILDKVVSIKTEQFFFDFIRQLSGALTD